MPGDDVEHLPGAGVDLVVLRAGHDDAAPVLGGMSVALDSDEEPTGELLSELLDSTVRVTTAEGIPEDVLDALELIPVPAAFRASPWLAQSRPVLIRDDGTGEAGDLPVRYTRDQGLQILYPEPELDSDDSDDHDDDREA